MTVNMERRALVALGLLWLGGVRASAAPDVTGLWSAAVRSRGGLGAQMSFTEAEAISTFGALIDLTYEIAAGKIKIKTGAPEEPPMERLIARDFKIDGNTLTIEPVEAGPRMEMTRVDAPHPGAHPIVGDWTYMHQTGVPALQRFGRNGNAQLSVPFQTSRGPYRIDGDMMHIQFEGKPPLTLTIRREGNALITRDPQGKEIKFVKFEY